MASGSFKVYVRSQHTEWYQVQWSDKPVLNSNKSELTVSVRYYSKWKTQSNTSKDLTLWIDGDKYTGSGKIGVKGYSDILMKRTKTISHNSNGKKSIKIRFKGEVGIRYSGKWYSSVDSGSVTIKLTDIDSQPSSFTVENKTIIAGDKHSFKITRKTAKTVHTVVGKVGSHSWTILSKSSETGTISFTVPANLGNYMSAKQATVSLTCTTYLGSTKLGSKTGKFTVKLPSTVKPSVGIDDISITVSPNSDVKDGFIQGKSKAVIKINKYTLPTGTKLKQFNIKLNGKSYVSKDNAFETGVLKKSGTNTVKIQMVDTRGSLSSEVTKTFTVHPYSPPVIKSVTATRHNGTNPDPKGTKLHLNIDWVFSKAGGLNKTKLQIFTKLKSSKEYGEPKKVLENVETFSGLLDETYPTTSSYDIGVIVTDSFDNATRYFSDIDTEEALLDISPKGIAIGKIFEGTTKQFQCQYPAVFQDKAFINGTTAVTSDIRMKDVIEPLQPILEEIWEELGIYTFKYKNNPDKLNLGVIAQDVIKVFDNHKLDWKEYSLVIEDNGQYYVNYEFLNMITMYVVQQLQIQMIGLTARLDEIEKKLK